MDNNALKAKMTAAIRNTLTGVHVSLVNTLVYLAALQQHAHLANLIKLLVKFYCYMVQNALINAPPILSKAE